MAKPRTKPPALPTIDDEIALLAARRNRLSAWLERRLAAGHCDEAEALRCLATLSQVTGRLAGLIRQRAAAGEVEELEQFFEEVSLRVDELVAGGALPALGDDGAEGARTTEGAEGKWGTEGAGGTDGTGGTEGTGEAGRTGPPRPRRRPRCGPRPA